MQLLTGEVLPCGPAKAPGDDFVLPCCQPPLEAPALLPTSASASASASVADAQHPDPPIDFILAPFLLHSLVLPGILPTRRAVRADPHCYLLCYIDGRRPQWRIASASSFDLAPRAKLRAVRLISIGSTAAAH